MLRLNGHRCRSAVECTVVTQYTLSPAYRPFFLILFCQENLVPENQGKECCTKYTDDRCSECTTEVIEPRGVFPHTARLSALFASFNCPGIVCFVSCRERRE